jgi:hypothetical protein
MGQTNYIIELHNVCQFWVSISTLQVVLGLGVVAAGVYAVHTIAMPYLTSLYSSWTASVRARQQEQEVRRLEVLAAAEALGKVQVQLLAASESMAEAARTLKEQAAR